MPPLTRKLLLATVGLISHRQRLEKLPGMSQTARSTTLQMVGEAERICGINKPESGRLFMATQVINGKLKR